MTLRTVKAIRMKHVLEAGERGEPVVLHVLVDAVP